MPDSNKMLQLSSTGLQRIYLSSQKKKNANKNVNHNLKHTDSACPSVIKTQKIERNES